MIEERLKEDLKLAMKAGDALVLSTLRMASAALHNKAIEKRAKSGDEHLTDEEALSVLRTEVKRRRDASLEFGTYGRPELAKKEAKEAELLLGYLPAEADDVTVDMAVRAAIEEVGSDPKQFGKIMGLVMRKLQGTASGDRVQSVVKKLLEE